MSISSSLRANSSPSSLALLALLAASAACDSQANEIARNRPTAPDVGQPRSDMGQPLTDQTRIGSRTLGEWNKLPREEFLKEVDAHLATLGTRADAAREDVRAELREKRQQAEGLATEIRGRTQGGWEEARQNLLQSLHWLETKLAK